MTVKEARNIQPGAFIQIVSNVYEFRGGKTHEVWGERFIGQIFQVEKVANNGSKLPLFMTVVSTIHGFQCHQIEKTWYGNAEQRQDEDDVGNMLNDLLFA